MIKMIDLSEFGYTNFEKSKEENWNKYKLEDRSAILVKLVLFWVRLLEKDREYNLKYSCKTDIIPVPAPDLCGKPDSRKYTEKELRESIVDEGIGFDSVDESWNEYLLEHGIRLKIKPLLSKVSRTDKFNDRGEPLYIVEYHEPQTELDKVKYST
jgi:hypothetical protein